MPFPTTHPALAQALAEREYNEPTAVQSAILDDSTLDRDLLVSAQTGSGKTVAFGLALASTLLGDAERFGPAGEPLALIVAPTRELALQVHGELSWLYAKAGARVISCVGGMDVRREQRALQDGAHIVVGTPGRLRDHLERGRLDIAALRAVVLDEADEMLDLGFREDLQFILEATPAERRTLLFSATIAREIAALARDYQRDALRIDTAQRDRPHGDIAYQAVRVAPNDVEHAVVNLLRFHEVRAALVFCSTRETVRRLHGSLLERGFDAVALSGEMTQAERTRALQSLRDGRSRVCVATDVAARGLDLPDLGLVIHADLPTNRETLLHRSGRTGRAGRKGVSALIVPSTRRRRAEGLLSAAGVQAEWIAPPVAEDIRTRDQERLLSDPLLTEAAGEEDLTLANALLAERSPVDIAAALIRLHRSRLPAPEDLLDLGPDRAVRPARAQDRGDRAFDRGGERAHGDRQNFDRQTFDRPHAERDDAAPSPGRRDFGASAWYVMSVGRQKNADPRWLLPLICRLGHLTKKDIGAIRIFDRETRFEIAEEAVERFNASIAKAGKDEVRIRPDAGGGERPQKAADGPVEKTPHDKKPFEKKPYAKKREFRSPPPLEAAQNFSSGTDAPADRDFRPERDASPRPARAFRRREDTDRAQDRPTPARREADWTPLDGMRPLDGETYGKGEKEGRKPFRTDKPFQKDKPFRQGEAFKPREPFKSRKPPREEGGAPRADLSNPDVRPYGKKPFKKAGFEDGGGAGPAKAAFGKSSFGKSGAFGKGGAGKPAFGKGKPAGAKPYAGKGGKPFAGKPAGKPARPKG
jgi:ATP-dependent RNA helicase DeaD